MKKRSHSKVYWWGHIQVMAGIAVTALGYITPAYFKDLEPWMYGVSAAIAGVITYILREVTKDPVK